MTTVNVQYLATSNEWDAPLNIWRHANGTMTFRRDDVTPEWSATDPVSYMFMPHGVILVDGVMSEFDRKRQPS